MNRSFPVNGLFRGNFKPLENFLNDSGRLSTFLAGQNKVVKLSPEEKNSLSRRSVFISFKRNVRNDFTIEKGWNF